jgi:hypothetical protein
MFEIDQEVPSLAAATAFSKHVKFRAESTT